MKRTERIKAVNAPFEPVKPRRKFSVISEGQLFRIRLRDKDISTYQDMLIYCLKQHLDICSFRFRSENCYRQNRGPEKPTGGADCRYRRRDGDGRAGASVG